MQIDNNYKCHEYDEKDCCFEKVIENDTLIIVDLTLSCLIFSLCDDVNSRHQ